MIRTILVGVALGGVALAAVLVRLALSAERRRSMRATGGTRGARVVRWERDAER